MRELAEEFSGAGELVHRTLRGPTVAAGWGIARSSGTLLDATGRAIRESGVRAAGAACAAWNTV